MGKTILSNNKTAAHPYFLDESGINVYTVEELSFYITSNAYLLEKSFMKMELADWIRDELEMDDLYRVLIDIMEKDLGLSMFVKAILYSNNLTDQDEADRIVILIKNLEDKNEFNRMKSRADGLFEKGQPISAINEYFKVLGLKRDEEVTEKDIGNIYHNIAASYARLLLFERAEEYFEKAFELNHSKESFKGYLLCLKMDKNDVFYENNGMLCGEEITTSDAAIIEEEIAAASLAGLDEKTAKRLERIREFRRKGYYESYDKETKKLINDWKKEYKSYRA